MPSRPWNTGPLRNMVPIEHWEGPVYLASEIRRADRLCIEQRGVPGIVLMERAAEACAAICARTTDGAGNAIILAGTGNNGGDGSAVARLLAETGWSVTVVVAGDPGKITGDAATNLHAARAIGVRIARAEHLSDDELRECLTDAHVCVDALLGTGAEGAPRSAVRDLLQRVLNNLPASDARPFVLAVDLPTGVERDSGQQHDPMLSCDAVVAPECPGPAHFAPVAASMGAIHVAPIGIVGPESPTPEARAYGRGEAIRHVPRRSSAAHKYSRGHVLCLAGSAGMEGAGILTASAAQKAGAGLVTLATTEAGTRATLAREPSLLTLSESSWRCVDTARMTQLLKRFDSIVMGPGLAANSDHDNALARVVEATPDMPTVLDAGALRLLATPGSALRRVFTASARPNTVLTPHPGELADLLDAATPDVVGDLLSAAKSASERYRCTVVAKGSGAVIVSADERHFVYGHEPALATAGSGDLLAGAIGALLPSMTVHRAACLAAWAHVDAGRRFRAVAGLEHASASDLLPHLARAISELGMANVRGGEP